MLKTTESRLWQHANYCCVSQANFKAHSLAGALYKKMLLDGGGGGGGVTLWVAQPIPVGVWGHASPG